MENQWVQSISHTKSHESHIFGFAALFFGGEDLMDLDLPGGWLWIHTNLASWVSTTSGMILCQIMKRHLPLFVLKVNKTIFWRSKNLHLPQFPSFLWDLGGVASIWEIIGSEIKPENIIQPVEALRLTEHSMAPQLTQQLQHLDIWLMLGKSSPNKWPNYSGQWNMIILTQKYA